MFHPTVIAASLDRYYQDPSLAPLLDQLALPLHEDYPVVVCHQMKEELDGLVHEDGTVDAPSWEQQQFILHEVLRSKVDYAYCAQRYHVISAEAAGIKPLYPLWESQAITLDRLAQRELQCHREGWGAVMALLLKARQLGLSTLTQSILTHKVTTQGHLRALVASDIEDASKSLYGMFEIMLEHLPYWLKPPTRNKAVGERRVFDTGTVYWAAWGKSSRGGLKERGGQKGNLGRGKTISQFHLSELSTWEYPEQLDDGFFPAVPLKISTFGILESTAKGRGGYWHDKWRSTLREGSDFVGVFIPWYAEVSKYSRPAPASWSPRDETLAHARACEASSHRYLGRTAHLTREQLYWWEKKREEFEAQGRLYQFLEEWPATDEEAFQFSTASCFPIHLTERIANSAKAPLVVCELRPQTPAARLVDDERQRLLAAEEGRPFTPSATLDAPDPTARAGRPVVPILLPDGYGFRALTQADLRDRVASWGQRGLLDLLQVWEAPRRKGPRRYILAADVAEGVGKDRSVCDVIRCPTVMEPAEQVAQFITDSRDPASFAYVMDALGRWYTDEDGVEAMACPETNVGPGGVTLNTLQLHLGYGNLYIWEYIDAADPSRRLSRKAGWWTNTRTRPALLGKLYGALTTVDPITHQPDFIVHSPWTLTDLRDFQSPTGRLEDGEARSGAFDDCVMAAGIGIYVAWQKAGGERTPIEELRRARSAEQALLQTKADQQSRDWRNTPCPAEYQDRFLRPEEDPGDPDVTTRFEGDRLPAADSLFDNSQWFRYSR